MIAIVVAVTLALVLGTIFMGALKESPLQGHLIKGFDQGQVNLDELSKKRMQLITAGVDAFLDRPFLGFGLTNFNQVANVDSPDLSQKLIAHNMYISTAVELGIIGLFLLIFWSATTILGAVSLVRSSKVLHPLIIFFGAGLLSGSFMDIEYVLPLSVSLILLSEKCKTKRLSQPPIYEKVY